MRLDNGEFLMMWLRIKPVIKIHKPTAVRKRLFCWRFSIVKREDAMDVCSTCGNNWQVSKNYVLRKTVTFRMARKRYMLYYHKWSWITMKSCNVSTEADGTWWCRNIVSRFIADAGWNIMLWIYLRSSKVQRTYHPRCKVDGSAASSPSV